MDLTAMGGRVNQKWAEERDNSDMHTHTISVIFDKRQNEKSMTFIKGNLWCACFSVKLMLNKSDHDRCVQDREIREKHVDENQAIY